MCGCGGKDLCVCPKCGGTCKEGNDVCQKCGEICVPQETGVSQQEKRCFCHKCGQECKECGGTCPKCGEPCGD